MDVSILDNEDYMILISVEDPKVLHDMDAAGTFARKHEITRTLWLVRIPFGQANAKKSGLGDVPYKFIVVRYTSASAYRSSDPVDQNNGSAITGI